MELHKWVVGIGFAIVVFIIYRLVSGKKHYHSGTKNPPGGGGNGPQPK